ncbi:MAG: hypothetical protein NTX51_18675, partial [Verrucomicrobia bacterium]|nr:hypothetical protein [Verrucomicrobiota bacterium]
KLSGKGLFGALALLFPGIPSTFSAGLVRQQPIIRRQLGEVVGWGLVNLNSAVVLTAENAKSAKRGGYELIADVFHSPGG